MPSIIAESDAFPAVLTVPNAAEPASAPTLLSQFFQGAANRTRWLYNRVKRLEQGGTFTLASTLSFTNFAVVLDALIVNNAVSFYNQLVVAAGGAAITGNVTISGNLQPAGITEVHTFVGLGPATISGKLTCSSIATMPATGNGTLSPNTARLFYWPTQSAAQSYTISDSGCTDGDFFEVFLAPAATSNLTIYDTDGSTILTILYGTQTAHSNTARFYRTSGHWFCIQGILNSSRTI